MSSPRYKAEREPKRLPPSGRQRGAKPPVLGVREHRKRLPPSRLQRGATPPDNTASASNCFQVLDGRDHETSSPARPWVDGARNSFRTKPRMREQIPTAVVGDRREP